MNLTLTNNFYTWMRTVLMQTGTVIKNNTTAIYGFSGNEISTVGTLKNENGEIMPTIGAAASSTSAYPYAHETCSLNTWESGKPYFGSYEYRSGCIYFGIGNNTIAATEDDYALSGNYVLDTDYSATWRVVSNPKEVNGKGLLTYNMTFTAINNITIGEIGMFKRLSSQATSNNTTALEYCFNSLFGRIALNDPIELSTGESATFQISIEI